MPSPKHRRQPWVTVDVVIVAPVDERLKILLIRRKRPPFEDCWAIPGGFVEPNEQLEAAARRELWEETGAEPDHLEQLHTFGEPGRDPRGWVISVVYLAVLNAQDANRMRLEAGSDASEVCWFDLDSLPPLAFDHAEVLALAVQRLAANHP